MLLLSGLIMLFTFMMPDWLRVNGTVKNSSGDSENAYDEIGIRTLCNVTSSATTCSVWNPIGIGASLHTWYSIMRFFQEFIAFILLFTVIGTIVVLFHPYYVPSFATSLSLLVIVAVLGLMMCISFWRVSTLLVHEMEKNPSVVGDKTPFDTIISHKLSNMYWAFVGAYIVFVMSAIGALLYIENDHFSKSESHGEWSTTGASKVSNGFGESHSLSHHRSKTVHRRKGF